MYVGNFFLAHYPDGSWPRPTGWSYYSFLHFQHSWICFQGSPLKTYGWLDFLKTVISHEVGIIRLVLEVEPNRHQVSRICHDFHFHFIFGRINIWSFQIHDWKLILWFLFNLFLFIIIHSHLFIIKSSIHLFVIYSKLFLAEERISGIRIWWPILCSIMRISPLLSSVLIWRLLRLFSLAPVNMGKLTSSLCI